MILSSQPSSESKRRQRGSAEIETVLVIPILLLILYMALGTKDLGVARLSNVFIAERLAYTAATTPDPPDPNPDPDRIVTTENNPIDGIWEARSDLPALPNRMLVSTATTTVKPSSSNIPLKAIPLKNHAEFVSPAWAYSGWPRASDTSATDDWLSTYLDEVRAPLVDPLGLAPSWPP